MSDNVAHDQLQRQMRRLAFVPRWAIFPTNRSQSVAEHSFHVSHITLWLLGFSSYREDKDFVLDCLIYAITHDADESVTGDIPSPSKMARLDRPQSEILVKVADGLEAYAFLLEEKMMGNGAFADPIIDDVLQRTQPYFERMEWHGNKPSWPNFLKLYRPTVYHPVYKHPVLEIMAENSEGE